MTVAKNYLREGEIDGLNRIVSMFLDFAEDQAERRHLKEIEEAVETLPRADKDAAK